jgi:EF-hand calcium-binding domain-containing protein 11
MEKEIREAFETFDDGDKGYLNRHEYKYAILSLFGTKPSRSEVEMIFQEGIILSDLKSNFLENKVNLQRFFYICSNKLADRDPDMEHRAIFVAMDSKSKLFLAY